MHRTERGGEATYHGPGQIVLYPIVNLRDHEPDLHWYMRSLEEVAIIAMEDLGVRDPGRVEGLARARGRTFRATPPPWMPPLPNPFSSANTSSPPS